MRIICLLLAGAAVAGASAAAARPTAEADVSLGRINNQYICTFGAAVAPGAVQAETARAAGPSMGEVLYTYQHTIRGFAVRLPADPARRSATAELKRNNSKVAGCEQDQIVKAFVQRPGGGGTSSSTQTVPWGITRVGGVGSTTSKRAWVIDTGIDLDHPDLKVDLTNSKTFVKGTKNADDQNGHGTHVAGTIAALDNTIGVVGVSPGTLVVAVRVLDRRGSGTTSGVIAGVDYVASKAAAGDVANMSLGGGASTSLDNAVILASDKGIWFTLAAGNSGADANNYSPARANGTYIRTVSAHDSKDVFASWSNYGNPPIDYAEPGVSVYSTYKDKGYATLSGTSMAAPHLAGILLLTADGSSDGVKSGGQVKNDKDSTADTIGCWTSCSTLP